MQFGVVSFLTDYSIGPVELAVAMEARGLGVLMVPEHTHTPGSRETPFPGGGELPREYNHILDPFVALSAAAAATERLEVGTGISLVIQHDPIVLAKQVSSLDHVSNGRFLFGIGGGWNREEMAHHGTEFSSRWTLLRERIEAMKAIWLEEEASYHGKFVNFDRVWQWPKPIQKPHPPIIVGGDAPQTLQRVIRYGDEWMPLCGPDRMKKRNVELQALAQAAGRKPIPVGIYGCRADQDSVEAYIDAGASRILFWMKTCDSAQALPLLDQYAELASRNR